MLATTTSATTRGTGSIFTSRAISIVIAARKSMTVMLLTNDASSPAKRGNTINMVRGL